jgi:hypothetical protein
VVGEELITVAFWKGGHGVVVETVSRRCSFAGADDAHGGISGGEGARVDGLDGADGFVAPGVDGTQVIPVGDGGLHSFGVATTKIDEGPLRVGVDIVHLADLDRLFSIVSLVDAEGIGPEKAVGRREAEIGESFGKAACDWDVNEDCVLIGVGVV